MLDSLVSPVGTALASVNDQLEWVRKELKRLEELERFSGTNLDAIATQCGVKSPSQLKELEQLCVKIDYSHLLGLPSFLPQLAN